MKEHKMGNSVVVPLSEAQLTGATRTSTTTM